MPTLNYSDQKEVSFKMHRDVPEPFLGSSSVLRNPMAICFPACCAFTCVGKFERMGLNLGNDKNKEEFQKRVAELCDLPSEVGFTKPPTGSFCTMNAHQRENKVYKWLLDMGFEVIMDGYKNYTWGSAEVDLLFRMNPKYKEQEDQRRKDRDEKKSKVKEVF